MSKRVHELAKELGLKTQELIDRIQKGGYDVKPSPLASLDPELEARIRRDVGAPDQPAPTVAATPAATPEPSALVEPSALAEPPPPVAAAPPPPKPTPVVSPLSSPPAGSPPASKPAPRPGTPPSPPTTRAATSGPLSMHTRPAAGGGPPAGRAAGPLSAHTLHRGTTVPRGGPESTGPGTAEPRGPSSPAAPLRPTDYIGPAGTRPAYLASGRPAPSTAPPLRRPPAPPAAPSGGIDTGRREAPPAGIAPRRPLPTVAAPTTPTAGPRRPEGPRPGEAAGKSQRPDVRLTPEQIRQMMQSGQIGGPVAPTVPGRGGAGSAPGRLGAGHRPTPGPGAAPSLRRPPGPPSGASAPVGLIIPPASDTDDDERRTKTGTRGGAADRAGRRAKRAERASERARVTSPVDARSLIDGDDDAQRTRGLRRHKGSQRGPLIAPRKTTAQIEPPFTLRNLSEAIGVKANDLIRKLMAQGQLVTINTTLDDETAQALALEFGVELEIVHARTAEDEFEDLFGVEDNGAPDEHLQPRPPVITILGHVDHGKTSLLDKIRQTNVVATESGGITQHIGAYQVEHNSKKVTFVDTPGHEAFTAMRARGANVTDIVVLVVAADDGVMPQTKEAIAHAKAAEVPVVVALNKIDLPNVDSPANLSKIYSELSQEGLIPEEYGGDVPVVKTSAVSGRGIDDLLENLEVLAELHELKANPEKPATGTCLEAAISEGRGVVATVLVQDGTLRVGDVMVCGSAYGRVRALFDDRGRPVSEAPPSCPVEVSGLDEVPTAGEKFAVVPDITRAREVAETRRDRTRVATATERQELTLENLFKQVAEQKVKNLNLILKADVQGSLEALTKELEKIQNPEVPIRVLLKGVGAITESDVVLADASNAIIIGFRVAPEDRAITAADEKKIDIRRYDIIYQVTDEIKKAVEGMLVPEIKETHTGRAVVRQVFKISKVGNVAGCVVTQGVIERAAKARILREGREIYKGDISALKRFKDDVREVREGYECGIKISNYDDIKVDDVIEAYRIDVIRRTL